MYKKASSELVVARRRRGSDNGREHVRVAAADRVQGPLVEDHRDDAVERDDRRVPRARERVVVEAEHLTITLNDSSTQVLEAAAEDDVEGIGIVTFVVEVVPQTARARPGAATRVRLERERWSDGRQGRGFEA